MMTASASLFVIVFTLVNILACLWLMWWTARTRSSSHAANEETAPAPAKTGHVWDGDLEEYNNPLPRWWLGLFILTIVFGIAYLVYYPGLGNFAGHSRWSQIDAWKQEMQQQQAKLETRLAAVKDKSLRELSRDPQAMSMAKNLFGANCSTCHGSDARGAKGFPNLTDADWLWGDGEDTTLESVANGRHGIMPGWSAALGDQGLNEVASYVVSLSGREAPTDWVGAGKARYDAMCIACHGADGRGNTLMGAPNLTDKVWLHGGDFASIRASIANGRDNQMPAHAPLLGDTKVRLLAAYVLSLGARDAARLEAQPAEHARATDTKPAVEPAPETHDTQSVPESEIAG